jgi:hypothetical protein
MLHAYDGGPRHVADRARFRMRFEGTNARARNGALAVR